MKGTRNDIDTSLVLDDVARRVVEEVLARLSASGTGRGGGEPGKEPREERLFWMMASPCGHLEEIAKTWRRLDRAGYGQHALVCGDVASAIGRVSGGVGNVEVTSIEGLGVSEAARMVAGAELVYVGSLGWKQGRDLGELMDDDPFVFLILDALAAKKPVFCLRDPGLGGLLGASGGELEEAGRTNGSIGTAGRVEMGGRGGGRLAREARRRWQEMESVGVRAVSLDDVKRPLAAARAARSSFNRAAGGLVTEKDVEQAAREGLGSLMLAPATVVTPLARDRARELGVELRRS